MTVLVYTVPGDPIPKARPRVYGKRTVTDPRTVDYEALVRMHSTAAVARARRAGVSWDVTARMEVQLVVHRANRRAADLDNIEKAFLDAVQRKRGKRPRPAVLFNDDSQVDHVTKSRGKVDPSHPRLVVLVRSLTVAESEAIALAAEQCLLDCAEDET